MLLILLMLEPCRSLLIFCLYLILLDLNYFCGAVAPYPPLQVANLGTTIQQSKGYWLALLVFRLLRFVMVKQAIFAVSASWEIEVRSLVL